MKSRTYINRTFVRQQGQSDCGVVCLASLLAYHGGYSSLERLRELSGTNSQGTSMLGLYQAALQLGFDAEGLEADSIEKLKTAINEPVILHVLIDDRLHHYIVCYGWDSAQNHFLIGDPAQGVLAYTIDELASIWSSRLLLSLTPTASLHRKGDMSKVTRRWLFSLIREDIPLLSIATVLGIVTAGLGLAMAMFSQKLIDEILPNHDSKRLIAGLLLLSLLLVGRAIVGYLRNFLINRQSRNFNNRISNRFYETLLHLPKSFFDSRKTGELVARLNDAGRIQRTVSYLTGAVVINTLVVSISAGYLFTYSVWVGLLSIVSIPLYGGLVWYYHGRIVTGQRKVMAASAYTESAYVETIQCIDVIKATNRESFFSGLTKSIYGRYQDQVYQLGATGLGFNLNADLINGLIMTGLLGLTSALVLHKSLYLGELMAILTLAGSIIPAVGSLALTNLQIQEAYIAFERMYEYILLAPEHTITSAKPNFLFTSLSIQHLSFRFPGRSLLLRDSSLTLERGEIVAILGESGSGKSTLFQLLQRFYVPETGEICVNEFDWLSVDTYTWRQTIGVVPQHIAFFSGTVLDNICLSDSAASVDALIHFCQQYGFATYFERFPQGYLTQLGEGGVTLSGGQRQLIALARALYNHPQLLLLDEPTAAMDPHTEQFVISLIEHLRPQMAVLMITHKPRLATIANRLYIMANGQLNEDDSHTVLHSDSPTKGAISL